MRQLFVFSCWLFLCRDVGSLGLRPRKIKEDRDINICCIQAPRGAHDVFLQLILVHAFTNGQRKGQREREGCHPPISSWLSACLLVKGCSWEPGIPVRFSTRVAGTQLHGHHCHHSGSWSQGLEVGIELGNLAMGYGHPNWHLITWSNINPSICI